MQIIFQTSRMEMQEKDHRSNACRVLAQSIVSPQQISDHLEQRAPRNGLFKLRAETIFFGHIVLHFPQGHRNCWGFPEFDRRGHHPFHPDVSCKAVCSDVIGCGPSSTKSCWAQSDSKRFVMLATGIEQLNSNFVTWYTLQLVKSCQISLASSK